MKDKLILDACCGSRMFWFDKNNPYAIYVDIRETEDEAIWKSTKSDSVRKCSIHPDILADVRNMPFEDNTFYHVVFDPPHMLSLGETSWMAKKYGRLIEGTWKDLIHDGFWECMRVLKPYGTLIFKWSEVDIKLSELLEVVGARPLYGHRSGKKMNTHWMAFLKIPEVEDDD